eukprot:4056401-Amphidinium_carterae.1
MKFAASCRLTSLSILRSEPEYLQFNSKTFLPAECRHVASLRCIPPYQVTPDRGVAHAEVQLGRAQ